MTTHSDRSTTPLPVVIAHRGASRAFPENTLAAFRGAAELGADWVELDVRRTSDRQLVVHHDAALPDGGEAIVGLRRGELPESVCSLVDALAICKQSTPPLRVNIEIKSGRAEPDYDPDYWVSGAVLDAVGEVFGHEATDDILITSFDVRAIDRVRALERRARTGLLTLDLSDADKVIGLAIDRGHDALNPVDHAVTADVVEGAHQAGLEVNVWTVDDPVRMRHLVELGVDGIITNVPDVARQVVDSRR